MDIYVKKTNLKHCWNEASLFFCGYYLLSTKFSNLRISEGQMLMFPLYIMK